MGDNEGGAMDDLLDDLAGPVLATAAAAALGATVDARSATAFIVTRRPTTTPTPLPSNAPTPLPSDAPTPLPSEAPTPLPSGVPTPLPSPAPTLSPAPAPTDLSFSFSFEEDGDDDEAAVAGSTACVCMNEIMVARIHRHCPHVAHHFDAGGCLAMTGAELEAIGESCAGLKGTYL